ncbi:MAG: hypothetical protein PHD46_04430 [Eubacteriales bacterium]|nr:hypothetical protein [Eubacteriales bacterium]MDD4422266.1 hypothetical protein [Eubacteriales bacterium]
MKKLFITSAVFAIIFSVCLISASAVTTSYLPEDPSVWKSFAEDGPENVTVTIEDGATVVRSDGTAHWPCAALNLSEEDQITVPIEGTSLEYDFTVDGGKSSILFFMKGDSPDSYTQNMYIRMVNCVPELGMALEADIAPGTYSGTITLEEMFKNMSTYQEALKLAKNDDNTLTFSGLKIYSVGGSVVTVNKFQFITTEEISATSSDESKAVSTDDSDVSSKTDDKSTEPDESNESDESKTSETPSTVSESTQSEDEEKDNKLLYILIPVALVVVIGVVFVATKKKK